VERAGGFIKLHRRVASSALWRSMTAEQRAVMIQLLFLANWKPDVARWKDHFYRVERGELSHSLTTIAREAGTSVKVVRSALKSMMADDRVVGGNGAFLTERYPISGTGPGTGPRILTIVNYSKYQDAPDDKGTGPGTGEARAGHGSGTGGAQREEGEEGEEVSTNAAEPLSLLPREPSKPVTPFVAWIQATFPDVKDPWKAEEAWVKAYPGVDLLAEGLKAAAWEVSNPSQRKSNHSRFLNTWFARAQDRGPAAPAANQPRKLRDLKTIGDRS
jgi:hypothetical protein